MKFVNIRGQKKFREGHAFIGYQKDTPAAVVFQASKQLKRGVKQKSDHDIVKDIANSSEKEGSEVWKQAVRLQSDM